MSGQTIFDVVYLTGWVLTFFAVLAAAEPEPRLRHVVVGFIGGMGWPLFWLLLFAWATW